MYSRKSFGGESFRLIIINSLEENFILFLVLLRCAVYTAHQIRVLIMLIFSPLWLILGCYRTYRYLRYLNWRSIAFQRKLVTTCVGSVLYQISTILLRKWSGLRDKFCMCWTVIVTIMQHYMNTDSWKTVVAAILVVAAVVVVVAAILVVAAAVVVVVALVVAEVVVLVLIY